MKRRIKARGRDTPTGSRSSWSSSSGYFAVILVKQQIYLGTRCSADQAAAEARLATAKAEHERLVKEKDDLNRLDYIEKIAREELGMTRRGELPYSSGKSVGSR